MATRSQTSRPAPAKDDQPRGLIPTFAAPTPPPAAESPPAPEEDLTGPARTTDPHPTTMTTGRARMIRAFGLGGGGGSDDRPREASPDPLEEPVPRIARTGTSTAGDDPKPLTKTEVTGLVLGILAVGFTVAAGVIRSRARRQLRKPTDQEAAHIAEPVGRILARRAAGLLALFGPDIADGLQAAAATGAYIGNGPLLQPLDAGDPNIPANLQEPTE